MTFNGSKCSWQWESRSGASGSEPQLVEGSLHSTVLMLLIQSCWQCLASWLGFVGSGAGAAPAPGPRYACRGEMKQSQNTWPQAICPSIAWESQPCCMLQQCAPWALACSSGSGQEGKILEGLGTPCFSCPEAFAITPPSGRSCSTSPGVLVFQEGR